MADQNILVRIGADISNLTSGLRNAGNQLSNFSSQTQKGFKAVGTVGKTMSAMGLAVAGGFGLAVKTAADFESAMSRVGALSGASGKDISKLTDTAKQLGATTSFSASQAAEGMQYLAMAGYKTNDIISAMPGLLSAAAAGQTDLATTSDIVSNVLSGFGMKAGETAKVADILTKTFTNSNTDLNMLGLTMKYVAPVAKASGQSLESMAAAAGILGNAGIQADSAGTALRMMLIRLAKPPKMAKDALKQLGISVSDSSGKMKPLSQIIGEISKKTANMSQAERLATVAKISGTEASASMLALMDAGQGTIDNFTKSLENSGGTADEIAKKQLDNLNGQITILKSALEGAAISIGGALLPALKVLTSGIQKIVDAFNRLPDGVKSFIAIGGALTAVFLLITGPILILISIIPGLIEGFGAIAGILGMTSSALAVSIGWVFLIIAAIIALGIGIYQAYKHSDAFRNGFEKAMAAVKAAGVATFGYLQKSVQKISDVFTTVIIPALESFKQKVVGVFEKVGSVVAPILSSIVTKLKNFGGEAKGAFDKAMNLDFSGIAEMAAKFIPSLIGYLVGGIPRLVIVGMNLISSIADGMGMTVPQLMDKVVNAVTGMINSFLAQVPTFLDAGIQLITGVINGILSAIPTFINMITQIVNTVTSTLTTMVPQLLQAGVQIILALIQGVTVALPQILTAAIQVITSLLTAIIGALPVIINAGISVLMALIGGILQALPMIITAGMTLLTSLITGIVQVLPLLITAAINLILSIVSAIIQMLPAIIDAGIQILLALIDGIIQLLPMLISAALKLLFSIIDALITNLPKIIDAGVKLVIALINGLIKVIPMLIQAAFTLIIALIGGIIKMLPQILRAGVQLIEALVRGLISVVGAVIGAAAKIGGKILDEIGKIDLLDIGKNIIKGLINGIGSMAGDVGKKVADIAKSIPQGIKDFLHIKSPSRVTFALGEFTGKGLENGINDRINAIKSAAANLAKAAVPDVPKEIATANVGVQPIVAEGNVQSNVAQPINLERMFDGANITLANGYDVREMMREAYDFASNTKRRRGQR